MEREGHVRAATRSQTRWLEGKDPGAWLQEQREDPDIGQLVLLKEEEDPHPPAQEITHLSQGFKTLWVQWDNIQLHKDVLCRKWTSDDKTVWQALVPLHMRKPILESLHCEVTSGHLGIAKTASKVQQRFYWPAWRRDIELFIDNCDTCCARKPQSKRDHAPMQKYLIGHPHERVAMDILGPLPVTNRKS